MDARKRTARFAGLLYLLMGLPGPFVLLYVPGRIFVRGDAAATALKLRAQEALWQLNIVAHLWTLVLFIFLALTLYRLLGEVHRMRAATMVVLVLVSVSISFLSLLGDVAILAVQQGGEALRGFSREQLDSLIYLLFVLRGKTHLVAQVFWGLWLLPFGLLILRSGFLPRLLGILLIPNGIAYPVLSLIGLFFPAYYGVFFNAALPALLGELWVQLWLLFLGTREPRGASPATS